MSRLVFGIKLSQPLPLSADVQQLQLTLAQALAGGLGPRLETGTRQQVAQVTGGCIRAISRVTLRQGGIGALLKVQCIHDHGPIRPQQHFTCLQHDAVMAPQCLPCVVSRLAQVGRPRLRLELRPQGIDHFISSQTLAWLQAQELHQLRGAQAGPSLGRQFDTVDGDRKAAKDEGVEARERPGLIRQWCGVHTAECPAAGRAPQAPQDPGTFEEHPLRQSGSCRVTVHRREPAKEPS